LIIKSALQACPNAWRAIVDAQRCGLRATMMPKAASGEVRALLDRN
jgi:hypothetical protein